MFRLATSPRSRRVNRRNFLQAATVAGLGSMLGGPFKALAAETGPVAPALKPTGSDVGSLFPFIQSQAVTGEFPLAFLNPRFRSLRSWKKTARGKLLDLLHYAPPPCDPAAETVARVDCGDYVREEVRFNTTPEVRVPAFVLARKNAPKRARAEAGTSSRRRTGWPIVSVKKSVIIEPTRWTVPGTRVSASAWTSPSSSCAPSVSRCR